MVAGRPGGGHDGGCARGRCWCAGGGQGGGASPARQEAGGGQACQQFLVHDAPPRLALFRSNLTKSSRPEAQRKGWRWRRLRHERDGQASLRLHASGYMMDWFTIRWGRVLGRFLLSQELTWILCLTDPTSGDGC